jgi:hypothetical protein
MTNMLLGENGQLLLSDFGIALLDEHRDPTEPAIAFAYDSHTYAGF